MKFRLLVLILLVTSLLVFALPVIHAQEATETPAPVVTSTPTPTGGVGYLATPEGVGAVFILLSFLAVGFAAGRYRPGEVAREMQKNQQALDSAERIALNTIPVTALDTIRGIIADGKAVLDLADELTDGKPNVVTPPDVNSAG